MLAHAVVVGLGGRPVPGRVLARLGRPDRPELPFVATGHAHWCAPSGSVAWAGWQAFTGRFAIASHWHLGPEGGVTAFSGHLWPRGSMWRTGSSWGEQLADWLEGRSLPRSTERLDGTFTAVTLDATGRGSMVTDPLSTGLLYRATTDEVDVVASHPGLAAHLAADASDRTGRDPRGVVWLAYLGYPVGRRTGYLGVDLLPSGSTAEVHPHTALRVHEPSQPAWLESPHPDAETAAKAVHQELHDSLASAAELVGRIRTADLTGGMDSRLILALLVESGRTDRFHFRTIGPEHAADVIVARRLAERYDLDHEVVTPGPMATPDFRSRLLTHVFQFSGLANAWDLKGGLGVQSSPTVSGLAGEVLRSYRHRPPSPATLADGRDDFLRSAACDRAALVRPEVARELAAELDLELVGRLDPQTSPALDHLDAFSIRNRVHTWIGPQMSLDNAGTIAPLLSAFGLAAAWGLGPDRRMADELLFRVMRRAAPELTTVPFAEEAWSPTLRDWVDDVEGPLAVEPVPSTAAGSVRWQANRLDDNASVVRELLLGDASNPVFDVLDRGAVERALGPEPPTIFQGRLQLFGALTAATWLGGHELAARFDEGA